MLRGDGAHAQRGREGVEHHAGPGAEPRPDGAVQADVHHAGAARIHRQAGAVQVEANAQPEQSHRERQRRCVRRCVQRDRHLSPANRELYICIPSMANRRKLKAPLPESSPAPTASSRSARLGRGAGNTAANSPINRAASAQSQREKTSMIAAEPKNTLNARCEHVFVPRCRFASAAKNNKPVCLTAIRI